MEREQNKNKKVEKWGFIWSAGVILRREWGVIRKIIIIFATNVALPLTQKGVTNEKSIKLQLNNKTD